MPRNPLVKESFLQGTRQKWFGVMLLFATLLLYVDAHYGIDVKPYLEFLTVAGSIFIAGAAADAVFKIKAADGKRQIYNEDTTTRREEDLADTRC